LFAFINTDLQGAPEGVLDRCQFVRLGTEKVPMSPALKAEINKQCKFYGTGTLASQCSLLASQRTTRTANAMALRPNRTEKKYHDE